MKHINLHKSIRIILTSLSLKVLLSASLFADDSFPNKTVAETKIPFVEKMAKIPKPYIMRDWPEVSRKYYQYLLRPNHKTDGKTLMPVTPKKKKNKSSKIAEFDLEIPSYGLGKADKEIFTNLSAITGAKMVGIAPQKLAGFDILKTAKQWFDKKHGIYRHRPSLKSPELHSGIYGYWSSVYGVMLADLFPEDKEFLTQVKASTLAFKKIAIGLGCPNKPNFDTLGFNFDRNGPGGRNEPMNRLGNSPIIAWMNLIGYDLHKDQEMLDNAKSIIKYYSENLGRYELTHVMAPYVTARLNAQHNENYDMTPIYSTWFGDGIKEGWKITAGYEYNGITVDGIDGAIHKNGNFLCFTMGSLNGPAWILPALRYDQRYAKSLARYSLNMAVSMRLFQGYKLDWEHQDHKDWKDKYDPEYLLFYEALFSTEPSKERKFKPYATGDPIRLGWGVPKVEKKDYLQEKKNWFSKSSNNISFYMGNHIGLLGALCHPTDIPGIVRWDCLKSEWFHPKAYPTLLYHNPHNQAKEISLKLDDQIKEKVDLYDSITGKVLISGAQHGDKLKLNADQAVVLVAIPQNAKLKKLGNKLLANGIVIDYRAER